MLDNLKKKKFFDKLFALKKNLNFLINCVIDGYQKIMNQYALSVKIEMKQYFYNLNEKFLYYKIKFQAYIIEIDNIQLENMPSRLDALFDKLIVALIEYYSITLNEAIPEKFDFLNYCATFSQSLTTLIASLDFEYYNNSNVNVKDLKEKLSFHLNNGMLFQIESMLSCFSSEQTMVYEHYKAIQMLNYVFVHLPLNHNELTSDTNFCIHIDIKK